MNKILTYLNMGSKYPVCTDIKKPKANITINEEVATEIGSDYRTLPIFEKGLYEYTYKKYYSLNSNEYLKCRWLEYKKNIESRVFAPFQFIDIRDYHFYNCRNRFIPPESIHKKGDHRFKLKPGPGVDFRGQVPIPQDLLMKRGEQKTQKPKRSSKTVKSDEEAYKKDKAV